MAKIYSTVELPEPMCMHRLR